MTKSDKIRDIRTSILTAGLYSVDFFSYRNHPTISRDYTTYEIWAIIPEDDGTLTLSTIPIDPWVGKAVDLTLDSSWREPTIDKIRRIVERELSRLTF